jgi:hypothetical protein
VVPARAPELGEGARQPQRERPVALLHRPLQRLADVVVRLVEPVQRLDLAVGGQELLGFLRDGEHLVGVRPAHGDGLPAAREPVLGIGTNRREHRERAPVVLVSQERRRGELVQAEHDVDPERGDAATFATVEDRDRGLDAERARDHRRALVEAHATGSGSSPCSSPSPPRARCLAGDGSGMAPDRVVARPGAGRRGATTPCPRRIGSPRAGR